MVCFRVCQEPKCSFITGFRELKQIKSLTFFHEDDWTFPFHGGVVPILRVHGYRLEWLRIMPPVPSEKVHLIIECCPNIQELFLCISSDIALREQEVDQSSFYPPKQDLWFHEAAPLRMLKTLELKYSSYYSPFAISPEILLFLLSSPALTKITFINCPHLTDQIIEKACARNTFRNLTFLMLYNCRNVNQKGIDFFMNEMNPLTEIILERCGHLDISRLKGILKGIGRYWKIKMTGIIGGINGLE
jgi:hypothetical protein